MDVLAGGAACLTRRPLHFPSARPPKSMELSGGQVRGSLDQLSMAEPLDLHHHPNNGGLRDSSSSADDIMQNLQARLNNIAHKWKVTVPQTSQPLICICTHGRSMTPRVALEAVHRLVVIGDLCPSCRPQIPTSIASFKADVLPPCLSLCTPFGTLPKVKSPLTLQTPLHVLRQVDGTYSSTHQSRREPRQRPSFNNQDTAA